MSYRPNWPTPETKPWELRDLKAKWEQRAYWTAKEAELAKAAVVAVQALIDASEDE